MAESGDQPGIVEAILDQSLGRMAKIKLSGGVVGRMAYTAIWGVGALAIIAGASAFSSYSGTVVCGLAAIFVLLIVYWSLNTIKEYANKNPVTATLEGAELLTHQEQKFRHGMKSQPRLKYEKPESDPTKPALPAKDIEFVDADERLLPAPPVEKKTKEGQ